MTSLTLDVLVTEYVGAHSLLVCTCGGQGVNVEVNSEAPLHREGRTDFWLDPASIHLFDGSTGVAL